MSGNSSIRERRLRDIQLNLAEASSSLLHFSVTLFSRLIIAFSSILMMSLSSSMNEISAAQVLCSVRCLGVLLISALQLGPIS